MSMKKLIICEENVIGINDFMNEYLNVPYDGNKKLTHYEMQKYLIEKGHRLPRGISFNNVSESGINTGVYLAVREESKQRKKGKILVYENPNRFSAKLLLEELTTSATSEQLEKIRRKILDEKFNLGIDIFGDIVPKEELKDENYGYEITNSKNRQRKYMLTSGKHLKGRLR